MSNNLAIVAIAAIAASCVAAVNGRVVAAFWFGLLAFIICDAVIYK